MKRYRLHINGESQERFGPITEPRLPWKPGWQWLEEEFTPLHNFKGATRCDGSMVLTSGRPPATISEYFKHYDVKAPRGLQLLKQQQTRRAA